MADKRKRSFVRTPTSLTFASQADFKEYEKNKNSLKGKFADFCSDTSFTPIAHVYKAGSLWKKSVWVIVSLALTSYMAYQCSSLIQNYLKYPSEVDMKLEFAPELDFPSVTICNLNPIRLSGIERSEYAEEFEDLIEDGSDDLLYTLFKNQFASPEDSDSEEDEWKPSPPPTQPPKPPSDMSGPTTPDFYDGTFPGDMATEVFDENPGMSTPPSNPTSPPTTRRRRQIRETFDQEEISLRRTRRGTATVAPTENTTAMSNDTYNQWEYLEDENERKYYNKISDQHRAVEIISEIVARLDIETVRQMGHRKRDLIMSCKWQGYPCSPKNFTGFVNYKYGNCYTFNADVNISYPKPSLKTSNPGPLYGLELELFIEQDEYIPAVTQEAGARIVIHSRGKVPFPEDEGFTVSPGFLTSVGMRKTSIIRIPYPHGNCSNEFDRRNSLYLDHASVYSKQACMKSCFQQEVIKKCACGLVIYPIPFNVSVCSTDDEFECAGAVELEFKANKIGCDGRCPLPCRDEAFGLTISNAVWPSRNYQKNLRSRMIRSSSKLEMAAYREDSQEDVTKIQIFYQELNYQLIEQKPSYEFQNILSDLGGQLGLWLGVSILALGEIIDFLISVIQYCIFKMSLRKPNLTRGSTPIYPYRPPQV